MPFANSFSSPSFVSRFISYYEVGPGLCVNLSIMIHTFWIPDSLTDSRRNFWRSIRTHFNVDITVSFWNHKVMYMP